MKTKTVIKKSIIPFIFTLLLIAALVISDRVLCFKTEHGVRQARDFYAQPRNTIDVAFLGSSHIHCDINTALLWRDYGIAACDYSGADQPLWITYYYMEELLKYQSPKLVVLDLFVPAHFKSDYHYYWLEDNLCGMRFSLNKLRMLRECTESDQFWNYFPSFAVYHQRYSELTPEDWSYVTMTKKERAAFKGYTPYYNIDPLEEPALDQDKSGGLTLKSEIYLQKIISLAADHDIDLFFIVTPYITNSEDELTYNRIHEIAEQNGLEFNSTNYDYSVMGLDFETDFNDYSHLNYLGSCKFTDYLAKEMEKRYDLPDRRGDARWESWDRHVETINQNVHDAAVEKGLMEPSF